MTAGRLPAPPDWAGVVSVLAGRRLLVVGDVMLDEYLSGDARRVCPEAPVPVVEAAARWCLPGGAANAAANAAALGARALLGGVIGEDPAASELFRAARGAGIDPAGLLVDPTRPTTTKLRVLARGQQVIRVDTECVRELLAGPARQLAAWAEREADQAEAVLLSDYGKGVLASGLAAKVIASASHACRPVVVDPRGVDPDRYRGATVLKPNLTELGDLTGRPIRAEDEFVAAGQSLAEKVPGTAVLVTRGVEGMALFRSGCPPLGLAAGPIRRVFDVTGAGDTVAATLALALGAGLTVETAARVANVAAGVAVCKVGTAVVAPDELVAALRESVPDFCPLRWS